MAAKDPKSKLENQVDIELDDLLASLGPEVTTVKLYRIRGGKQEALDSYSPSQLSTNPEEIIGGDYGPGQYLLRVILPTIPGKPGNRWGPSKTITLAEDSQYVEDWILKHSHDPASNNSGGDPMFRFMELQMKMAEQRATDMDRRLAEQNSRFHDLILAMIQNNKGAAGGDIPSLIAGVRDLKELSDGKSGGSKFAELKELLEIAALLKDGGGGDETPWASLTKVVTAGLLGQKNGGGGTPAALNPPAAALDPNKVLVEKTELPAESPELAVLDLGPKTIQRLMLKATRGRDPELWSDWTVDQADDESDVEAIQLLTSIQASTDFETWWKVFPSAAPEVRDWWEIFYNRAREILQANAPPAPPAAKAEAAGAA